MLATLSLALTLLAPTEPAALATRRAEIDAAYDSLNGAASYREAVVSPDGTRVAWVESAAGRGRIQWQRLPGGAPKVLTAAPNGAADEGSVSFSPDGKRIAFLSTGKDGQAQVAVAEVDSGEARILTSLTGTLSSPRWSEDGKRLAFLFTDRIDAVGPLGPAPPRVGLIQADAETHAQRIHVIDAAGGVPRPASPPELFVYQYDWAPDGKSFAAVAARGDGDANWWVAKLYTFDAATGAASLVLSPAMQMTNPRFTPDGKSIAFVGGLMSDQGVDGGDLFLVSAAGSEPRNLTPGRTATPSDFAFVGPRRMVFVEWSGGGTAVNALDVDTGAVTPLWKDDAHLGPAFRLTFSLSRDGSVSAAVRHGFDRVPEVVAGKVGSWTKLASGPPVRTPWSAARSLRWKNGDVEGQTWLLLPHGTPPRGGFPMVVSVHGGPSWASHPRLDRTWATFTGAGYAVLLPNPRGSFGQGAAFTRGNVRDFGGGDFQDILASVDAALAAAPISTDRIGLTGHSYGGFMAMWAVTQTKRFRAVVSGAGIANWQSYYGLNRIDTWMIPFFGASVYDDPAIYRKVSPIELVKNVKTPTLILQGERDAEVPAPQAFEFWRGLRTMGVPTELVVYEGEGHIPQTPKNRRDWAQRTVEWFDRWMK